MVARGRGRYGSADARRPIVSEHSALHEDEIPIDDRLARALDDRQFPHWRHLHMRRILSFGTINAIFRVGDDTVMSARLERPNCSRS
jgi:hypothetical protein